MHFKIVLEELQDKKQVKMQIQNQSNNIENKTLVHPNGSTRNYLTFPIVPGSDVLFVLHGGEVGEQFRISGHVLWTAGVHDPCVL